MSTSAGGSRGNNGGFFFYIEGLPKKYTWQDLKDLIRREASHGIWTDMAIYPNGQTGGKGHARVQRREEANNLYQYLTTNAVDGRLLRIHLWDISGQDARFIQCNCESRPKHAAQGYPAQAVEVNRMSTAAGWQQVPPTSPTGSVQTSYSVSPAVQYASAPVQQAPITAMANPMAVFQQQMAQISPQHPQYAAYYHYFQQQYQQALRAPQAANQQAATTPAYAVSSNGIPRNMSNGTVRVEYRGVFVSNLNYKAHSREVKALFGQAGDITKFELQKDASSGKSKGNATIQYSSAREAQRAIELLNKKTYMNMQLNVRLDKEATAISPPPATQASRSSEPIIVNGSRVAARP